MWLTFSIWLYSHLKEEDQSILNSMYEKYTRNYVKNEDDTGIVNLFTNLTEA
ncbi:MAG: hypothetical protein HXS54_18940 [Theionarchaea archaeon]|nr:hypothetical protein [Theionarchaea archaeon]